MFKVKLTVFQTVKPGRIRAGNIQSINLEGVKPDEKLTLGEMQAGLEATRAFLQRLTGAEDVRIDIENTLDT